MEAVMVSGSVDYLRETAERCRQLAGVTESRTMLRLLALAERLDDLSRQQTDLVRCVAAGHEYGSNSVKHQIRV